MAEPETTDLTVAREIARQIGSAAFVMMGTRTHLGGPNWLQFDVKGSKRVNRIRITLEDSDTYTIQCIKVSKAGMEIRYVSTDFLIYCDKLHEIIESRTGLYLRLSGGPIREIKD